MSGWNFSSITSLATNALKEVESSLDRAIGYEAVVTDKKDLPPALQQSAAASAAAAATAKHKPEAAQTPQPQQPPAPQPVAVGTAPSASVITIQPGTLSRTGSASTFNTGRFTPLTPKSNAAAAVVSTPAVAAPASAAKPRASLTDSSTATPLAHARRPSGNVAAATPAAAVATAPSTPAASAPASAGASHDDIFGAVGLAATHPVPVVTRATPKPITSMAAAAPTPIPTATATATDAAAASAPTTLPPGALSFDDEPAAAAPAATKPQAATETEAVASVPDAPAAEGATTANQAPPPARDVEAATAPPPAFAPTPKWVADAISATPSGDAAADAQKPVPLPPNLPLNARQLATYNAMTPQLQAAFIAQFDRQLKQTQTKRAVAKASPQSQSAPSHPLEPAPVVAAPATPAPVATATALPPIPIPDGFKLTAKQRATFHAMTAAQQATFVAQLERRRAAATGADASSPSAIPAYVLPQPEPTAATTAAATPTATTPASPGPAPTPHVIGGGGGDHSNEINELKSQLKAANERAEQCEKASEELRRLVGVRESQLEKHALTSAALHTEISALKQQTADLTTELATERNTTRALKEERELLRRKGDSAEGNAALLKAKDDQIAAVMKEGEGLSKKQHELEHSIRKFRKEASEREKLIETMKHESEARESHVNQLQDTLRKQKAGEKQATDKLMEVAGKLDELHTELSRTQTTLKSSESNVAELRAALDTATQTLKQRDAAVSKLTVELREMSEQRDSLERNWNRDRSELGSNADRESALLRNVKEMSELATRDAMKHAVREEEMERELRNWRDKLRAEQQRNEELVSAVPAATRPLLRQIESLQSAMKHSQDAFQTVEAGLTARVRALELEAANVRAERELKDDTQSKQTIELAERTKQTALLKDANTALDLELKAAQKKLESVDDVTRRQQQQTALIQAHNDELMADKRDLEKRMNKLWEERELQEKTADSNVAAERALRQKLEAEIRELKLAAASASRAGSAAHATAGASGAASASTSLSSVSVSASSGNESSSPASGSSNGPNGVLGAPTSQEEILHNALIDKSSSVAGALSQGAATMASTVEVLKSAVRQRDGEVAGLRFQLRNVESTRDAVTTELVALTSKVTKLEQQLKRVPELESSVSALTQRYNLALDLIGEKEEELTEAKADLAHVKTIFRQQLTESLSAAASSKSSKTTAVSGTAAVPARPAVATNGSANAAAPNK